MQRRFIMLLPLLFAASMPAAAQLAPIGPVSSTPAPVPAPRLDAAARREIVAKLADTMRGRYVFPDVGALAAKKITAALDAGDYATPIMPRPQGR